MRKTLIVLFFLLQIGLIFYNLNSGVKFFNWAMYHTNIQYTAIVKIDGKELNDQEFKKRYKIPKTGMEMRALDILKRKMVQREKIYPDNNKVSINLMYTENTHKGSWTWHN